MKEKAPAPEEQHRIDERASEILRELLEDSLIHGCTVQLYADADGTAHCKITDPKGEVREYVSAVTTPEHKARFVETAVQELYKQKEVVLDEIDDRAGSARRMETESQRMMEQERGKKDRDELSEDEFMVRRLGESDIEQGPRH